MPRLWHLTNVTRLTLAHNRIVEIPSAMANLENMEILNLFNNSIEELPLSISTMRKLRILNLVRNGRCEHQYNLMVSAAVATAAGGTAAVD